MREFLQLFVFAARDGTFYGLFAIGIALLYRGTRAINFSVAQLAAFSLYAMWWLSTDHGLPVLVGLVGAVFVGVGLTLGFERVIVRRIPAGDRTTVTVASVGLLSLLIAVEAKFFSGDVRRIDPLLRGRGVTLFDVTLDPGSLLAAVLLFAAAFALTTVLRRTDFGLGVLAVAHDPDASRLMGIPARKVSVFLWGMGAAVSVVAGYLVLPTIGNLRLGIFAGLFTKALIGAVIGGLDRIWGAVAGAYTVAVLEAFVGHYVDLPSLPGTEWVAMLAAVLVVLWFRPRGLLAGAATRGAA